MAGPARSKIFDAATMTGTTVLTSDVISLDDGRTLIGVQLVWTSTAVGAWSFEGSCNYKRRGTDDATTEGDWTVFTLAASPSNPAGVAGSVLVDLSEVPWSHIRIKYTNASSTGVLNGYVASRSE